MFDNIHAAWGRVSHLFVAKEARCAVVLLGCARSSCVFAGISL